MPVKFPSKINLSAAPRENITNKAPDLTSLLLLLNHFHPVSAGIATFFGSHAKSLFIRKKRLLLKAGMICDNLYFIKKGAIRGFIRDGSKEITTWISIENELVTSIASLDIQRPSREYIQCIEDCELIVMSLENLNKLYEVYPEFNIIGRKLLQRYYSDAENRAFITRLSKAGQRYQYFLESQAYLANRIPLTFIASYLGITLETLSIVRKNIALKVNNA